MSRAYRLAALLAVCFLSACAVAPGQPMIGTWQGEPPGPNVAVPEIVTLTLYGNPNATSGIYQISTTIRGTNFIGAAGPRLTVWSGRWTRAVELDNGQNRNIVYLHDALSSNINQWAIGPGNTLQPTNAYLHRNLTPQEIALYTLRPLSGTATLPD